MKHTVENTAKAHKYNVGDELTVKIAAVTEVNGKLIYRIKGIENIEFREGGIMAMDQSGIRSGDVVYQVMKNTEEDTILLDAAEVQDIGTKEIKLCDYWLPMEKTVIFATEEMAERHAESLARIYGCKIVKGGLFAKETESGRP